MSQIEGGHRPPLQAHSVFLRREFSLSIRSSEPERNFAIHVALDFFAHGRWAEFRMMRMQKIPPVQRKLDCPCGRPSEARVEFKVTGDRRRRKFAHISQGRI